MIKTILKGKETIKMKQTSMTCDNCKFDCKSADNETCERFKNAEFFMIERGQDNESNKN